MKGRIIRRGLLGSLMAMLLTACQQEIGPPALLTLRPVQTMPGVDLKKYAGRWYEISAFPNRFQKGCRCTQATYSLTGDFVRVTNQCVMGDSSKPTQVEGKAWIVPGSNNSKLKVQFFWPFKGDYWIVYVSPDYQYSIVGMPSQRYLWILARQPKIDAKKYEELLQIAKERGYADTAALKKTDQNCS